MHPAMKFCEAVCKRASEDGWKLRLAINGFAWKKGDTTISYPVETLDASLQLHNACVALDKAHYNLSVELT